MKLSSRYLNELFSDHVLCTMLVGDGLKLVFVQLIVIVKNSYIYPSESKLLIPKFAFQPIILR